ncbi:MAG: hypothetical protein ABDK78_06830 [Atribacterota bacterium]
MKKLFIAVALALSLSLCINSVALGDPSSDSQQVQSFSPVVVMVER